MKKEVRRIRRDFLKSVLGSFAFLKRHKGPVSLCIACAGTVSTEALLRISTVSPAAFRILASGFEAAMAGAFADWFAISALFHRIPVPLLGRHTDIIASNRGRITDGIVDMVQNRWLSPDSIHDRLSAVNFSSWMIPWLQEGRNRDTVIDLGCEVTGQLVSEIDRTEVALFLESLLKDQMRDLDMEPAIGRFLLKALERGDQDHVWAVICTMMENTARSEQVRAMLIGNLRRAADDYAGAGMVKGFLVWIAEKTHALDMEMAADKLRDQLLEFIGQVRTNPQHPLRTKLDNTLRQWAKDLEAGTPQAKASFANIRSTLMQNLDLSGIIQKMLHQLRAALLEQLETPNSPLKVKVRRYLDRFMTDFGVSREKQTALDSWVRRQLYGMVRNPKFREHIGATVRSSIEKLEDRSLVNQIQDKVGDDLQYIRLNGALVGGVIGLVLGILKALLG